MSISPAAVTLRAVMLGVKHGVMRLPLAQQRATLAALGRINVPPRGTQTEQVRLGDRAALRVSAPGVPGDRAVLWLHGGAFITLVPSFYTAAAAHLSRAANAPVFMLDQRLAPEHPHPADVEDALAAFDALGVPTSFVGDSAGCTTALLSALALRDRGSAVPTALGLISPFVDLTLASSRAFVGREYVLRLDWLQQGVAAYVQGRDPAQVSALHQDLSGLPPTTVHWCEHERLANESAALARRLAESGVEVSTSYLPGLFHLVHLYPHLVPEAAAALADLGARLSAA